MSPLTSFVWIMLVSAGATGIAIALLVVAAIVAVVMGWGFLRYVAAAARRYFDSV